MLARNELLEGNFIYVVEKKQFVEKSEKLSICLKKLFFSNETNSGNYPKKLILLEKKIQLLKNGIIYSSTVFKTIRIYFLSKNMFLQQTLSVNRLHVLVILKRYSAF